MGRLGPVCVWIRLYIECFKTFKPFAFLLCCVRLGNAGVIICKGKKVSFCTKTNGCNWANEVRVDILIRPLRSLLLGTIVVFCCFGPLAAVTYAFVIVVSNVVTFQVFLKKLESSNACLSR